MKKILALIVLGLLFKCESEEGTQILNFKGHIRNGDFTAPTPSKEIKVKISYYGNHLDLLTADSTRTDDSGNYFFKIPDNEAIRQYSIQVRDEYYFQCNGLSPVITDFIIPKDINKSKPNSDTLSVCVTGKIDLFITKSNLAAKDTLTVSSKTKRGSISFISYPATILKSTQWSEYYFTKNLTAVEYNFILKKQNGE